MRNIENWPQVEGNSSLSHKSKSPNEKQNNLFNKKFTNEEEKEEDKREEFYGSCDETWR